MFPKKKPSSSKLPTPADSVPHNGKRALRAEIGESVWSARHITTSIPFEKPSKGKIAVRVINHNEDEVK